MRARHRKRPPYLKFCESSGHVAKGRELKLVVRVVLIPLFMIAIIPICPGRTEFGPGRHRYNLNLYWCLGQLYYWGGTGQLLNKGLISSSPLREGKWRLNARSLPPLQTQGAPTRPQTQTTAQVLVDNLKMGLLSTSS